MLFSLSADVLQGVLSVNSQTGLFQHIKAVVVVCENSRLVIILNQFVF